MLAAHTPPEKTGGAILGLSASAQPRGGLIPHIQEREKWPPPSQPDRTQVAPRPHGLHSALKYLMSLQHPKDELGSVSMSSRFEAGIATGRMRFH